jgi:Flp pilus assembly protein TadD
VRGGRRFRRNGHVAATARPEQRRRVSPNLIAGLTIFRRSWYRANNFGLAEKHFRRAVELHPRDAEARLGMAASYDRLRRFDLADRAYKQAIDIVGPTVEILNNQGFSYMLRGDFKRARQKLLAPDRKDPGNKYVANNMHLLEESIRQGKQVE